MSFDFVLTGKRLQALLAEEENILQAELRAKGMVALY
jgi:hypothetical protein